MLGVGQKTSSAFKDIENEFEYEDRTRSNDNALGADASALSSTPVPENLEYRSLTHT